MKKRTKIAIALISTLCILVVVGLGFAGNYFYDLALNPTTDKSMVFNNEDTKNSQSFEIENTFFKDTSYKDQYITNDGLKLHAYDFNQKSDVYVIVIHGYLSQADDMNISCEHFYNMGYNVLAIDLRSHGLSEGDYIGMGWDDRNDVLAWINLLIQQNKDTKIVLYGVSMGAATVMNTLGEEALPSNVKVAIEDCGYASTWDIFAYQLDSLFGLPATPFLDAANIVTGIRAGYDLKNGPIDQIANSTTPTLFIHGDQDTFVPFSMLDELYDKATSNKEKLVITGAGHAQSHLINPDLYWKTVDRFIETYL